jgi:hypothetical protein
LVLRANLVAGLALLVLPVLTGCAGPNPEESVAAAQVYTVRGEITQLPNPGRPDGAELYIRHEAIPDFVDTEGATVGMEAMTMGFPIGPDVDLKGLAVGDPIEFRLEVRWDGKPPVLVSKVDKVAAAPVAEPADTPADAAEVELLPEADVESAPSPPAGNAPHAGHASPAGN